MKKLTDYCAMRKESIQILEHCYNTYKCHMCATGRKAADRYMIYILCKAAVAENYVASDAYLSLLLVYIFVYLV